MGLFSNTSTRTNSKQKNEALRPITLRIGADLSLKITAEVLQKYNFTILSPRPDYHEIYAATNNCEFTFSFIEDFGKTHLTVLAFSEKHPFKIKKNLKSIMLFLREKLAEYME